MDDQPPAYDQSCPSMAAGYSPHEAGFSTQPGYNPVPQEYKSPPHGNSSVQGPPMVEMNQQSSTVVAAGYSPQEAGFSTQPGYNSVSQEYKSPPHGNSSVQGPPMVEMNQQSSTVVSAILLIIIIYLSTTGISMQYSFFDIPRIFFSREKKKKNNHGYF